jgi:hypothetical protein
VSGNGGVDAFATCKALDQPELSECANTRVRPISIHAEARAHALAKSTTTPPPRFVIAWRYFSTLLFHI